MDENLETFFRLFRHPASEGHIPRAVHAKAQACLQGSLDVFDDLPADIAHGLFAHKKTFCAFVRFSKTLFFSSNLLTNTQGMSVKIFDVPGARIDGGKEGLGEQDFLTSELSASFLDNATTFLELFKRLKVGGRRPLAMFFIDAIPFALTPHLKHKGLAVRTLLKSSVRSLLGKHLANRSYYSITPYKLGEGEEMKFAFFPRKRFFFFPFKSLRGKLKRHFEHGPIEFDFRVQRRTLPEREPLNDASMEWRSPWHTVGRLHIPRQDVQNKKMQELGEKTFFCSWNGLQAHRPIGDLNELRQKAYEMGRLERRAKKLSVAEVNFIKGGR